MASSELIKDVKKESISSLKGRLNYVTIDKERNEYLYEVDDSEIELILERSQKLKKELSKGYDLDNKTKEEEEEEAGKVEPPPEPVRRLLAILKSDTRVEITSSSSSPYKQIGLLVYNGDQPCTATLIASKYIITAGHCVHAGDGRTWYDDFTFYPGRTRFTTSITGVSYDYSRVWTFTEWAINRSYLYDIAVIELASSPNIGYLKFGYDDSINNDYKIYINGYPNDKPWGTMWSTNDIIDKTSTNYFLTDDTDTTNGNSGSALIFYPWYYFYLTDIGIYAIHEGSTTSYGITYNRHCRITGPKYAAICNFIDDSNVC